MAAFTIKAQDTAGIELTVRVDVDGSIVVDTPDSANPPNNLVVGRLPDGLVPDTSTRSGCELRTRRPTREQLVADCALAIQGWLLTEWATFGLEALQGCLGRLFRGEQKAPDAAAPLPPRDVGQLDPLFGSKLQQRVLAHLQGWHAANT